MLPKKLPMTALILAGGRSARMGRDKAFLPLGSATAVEYLRDRLQLLFHRVAVVTKSPEKFIPLGMDVIADCEPDHSSMIGLLSGLTESDTEFNFVIPCDTPFIPEKLIRHMAKFTSEYAAVVLASRGSYDLQPFPGFYQGDLVEWLQESVRAHRYELKRFLRSQRIHVVTESEWRAFDPQGRALINMNTPDEYSTLLRQGVAFSFS